MAGQKFSPALTPSWGGKMRFPAPKNMENSINEVAMMMPVCPFLEAPASPEVSAVDMVSDSPFGSGCELSGSDYLDVY